MGTFIVNVLSKGIPKFLDFCNFIVLQLLWQINNMAAAGTGSGKGSGLTKPMKVSADLQVVVGMKEASRAQCIKQLWAYLKANNLQDPENKQYFFPDKKMAKIFGNERIRAFGMAKFLGAHLTPI